MKSEIEQLFVKQLSENQNIVHKICRLYTHNQDAHNDLFQEISIQLWKAFPNFRGESKFSTWAYRVALNTAITMYRKSAKSIQTSDYENFSYYIKSEEYDDEVEEQLKILYKSLQMLNDIDKALVFLYLEDKDYTEISQTLGISEVNARVKMNRIKTKLKNILNP